MIPALLLLDLLHLKSLSLSFQSRNISRLVPNKMKGNPSVLQWSLGLNCALIDCYATICEVIVASSNCTYKCRTLQYSKIPSSSEFAGLEFSNDFSQWNCCILIYDMVYITTLPDKIIYLEIGRFNSRHQISARISSTAHTG